MSCRVVGMDVEIAAVGGVLQGLAARGFASMERPCCTLRRTCCAAIYGSGAGLPAPARSIIAARRVCRSPCRPISNCGSIWRSSQHYPPPSDGIAKSLAIPAALSIP